MRLKDNLIGWRTLKHILLLYLDSQKEQSKLVYGLDLTRISQLRHEKTSKCCCLAKSDLSLLRCLLKKSSKILCPVRFLTTNHYT